MSWKNTDPRDDINKRDDIVILRPDKRGAMSHVGTAHVDVKETFNIFTSFDDYKCIAADGKWDELWWWTRAPRCNPCTTVDLDPDEVLLQNKIDEYDSLITGIRNILTNAGIPDHEEYPDEEVDAREKSLRTGGKMIPLTKRVQMLADQLGNSDVDTLEQEIEDLEYNQANLEGTIIEKDKFIELLEGIIQEKEYNISNLQRKLSLLEQTIIKGGLRLPEEYLK